MSSSTSSRGSGSAGEKNIVACTEYGPFPIRQLSPTETIRFIVRDFVNLPQKQGEYFETQALEAHNFKWKLQIWPRGSSSGGWVSIYLACVNASTDKQAETCGKIQFGPTQSSTASTTTLGGGSLSSPSSYQYSKSFEKTFDNPAYSYSSQRIELQEILDHCLDPTTGNWIIDVDIQIYIEKSPVWYPKFHFRGGSRNHHLPPPPGRYYLESDLEADVYFVTGPSIKGGGSGPQEKKLHAHKMILAHRAPGLYEFAKGIPEGELLELPDTPNNILNLLLEYIYAGTMPVIDRNTDGSDEGNGELSSEFAKQLLLASSRFSMIYVKLHIESEITSKLVTPSNAADWLVFADSYCCALLKEHCMDMYSQHKDTMKSSKGWFKVKESSNLLEELLDYYSEVRKPGIPNHSTDYDSMTVGMLRDKVLLKHQEQQSSLSASKINLEILDGTREMLIRILKKDDGNIPLAFSPKINHNAANVVPAVANTEGD